MRQLIEAGVKRVVVVPDQDDPGRAHAKQVARSCHAVGLGVKIVTLPDVPPKGDLSDYLEVHTKEDLIAVIKAAPVYVPPALIVQAQNVPRRPWRCVGLVRFS